MARYEIHGTAGLGYSESMYWDSQQNKWFSLGRRHGDIPLIDSEADALSELQYINQHDERTQGIRDIKIVCFDDEEIEEGDD